MSSHNVEAKVESASLERIIPDALVEHDATGSETLKLHMARYAFAVKHVAPGVVLDMACGVGYGSYYLAQNTGPEVSKIIAVDISPDAIAYAKQRYQHPKIEFLCADATRFTSGREFQTIVSLETIEHIPDPARFIAHLKTLLDANGTLIGSVPVTPSVDANPHHITDFTETSFRKMCAALEFEPIDSLKQVQPFSPFRIVTRQEERMEKMRQNIGRYYLQHPGALLKRIYATVVFGFSNRYLTVAWRSRA